MLYQKKNNTLEPLTGSTLYAEAPIGTVIASFLAVAPSGYIKADDTVYTKAQYPELYERIPDVFKDLVNETFTIDLREVALKGIGLSSLTSNHYSSTGLTLGEFIEDRLQQHKHSTTAVLKVSYGYSTSNRVPSANGGNYNLPSPTASGTDVYSTQTANILVDGTARYGATTEVKSVGVNYFIKAKHVALPIDIMDAISEEYATKEYIKNYVNPNIDCTISGSSFTFPADKDGLWFVRIGGQGNNTGYAVIATCKIYSVYNAYIVGSGKEGTGASVSSVSWDGDNITVTMSSSTYYYNPSARFIG